MTLVKLGIGVAGLAVAGTGVASILVVQAAQEASSTVVASGAS